MPNALPHVRRVTHALEARSVGLGRLLLQRAVRELSQAAWAYAAWSARS
ncbi:MAG TPA: hypothetical protein VJ884_10030 [Salinibacter sp.]|nr:hypothetical protein [Salinibacter sp.]